MCMRVECSSCHKPTWSGCGRHIEQALAGVPKDKRCSCREKHSAAKPAAQPGQSGGFLSLFGLKERSARRRGAGLT